MAARSHVPQFGNWDSQEVPYTVYFDKARKGRGGSAGKMINPNDPQENPEMFSNIAPSPPPTAASPSPSRFAANGQRVSGKPNHEPRMSKEEGNFRQSSDSPARNDNLTRRTSGESAHQQNSGNRLNPNRQPRQSAGSEYSFERSPMHPQQAKVAGRGGASPAYGDGSKNSYDSSSHGNPGKSRMKQATRVGGDESPDGSAAVPRFGDWDESNPQSADNYTHIFNQVRDQRHNGDSNPSGGSKFQSSYGKGQKQTGNGRRQGGCFPCLGI